MTFDSMATRSLASVLLATLAAAQAAAPGQRHRSPVPVPPDCNGNGVPDAVDLASGWSEDCDGNLVPDECDVGARLLLSQSFEAGEPAGWGFGGMWHVTNACPRASECSGTNHAYFGDSSLCTFGSGVGAVGGTLHLPTLDLPAGAQAVRLTYCSSYEGEGVEPYDAADVRVNDVVVDHVSPVAQLDWEVRSVDLTPFLGQAVDITFDFEAMDSLQNDFLGWQVDNVRVLAVWDAAPGDCDGNGQLDSCEVASGAAADCNANGTPDVCDLAAGSSPDCQSNGIPDECELASGASADCNGNLVPDECDIATVSSPDCQANGVPDECEVASGASQDCNGNLVPDECDVTVRLEEAVSALALSHATITSFFADTYEFSEGESGVSIGDGGLNMYDFGNTLRTDFVEFIEYTGSVVVSDLSFGVGSSYFTAKHPGLFVLGATDCDVDYFEIRGRIGAGSPPATVDVLELSVVAGSQPYRLYVKRVYGGPQPSVNQILIVPGDGTGVVHTYHPHPTRCLQTLTGLEDTDRIYYALVSRYANGEGLPLRPVDAQEIAREVIGAFPLAFSSDDNDNGLPDECE